jgi:hypothetical protein
MPKLTPSDKRHVRAALDVYRRMYHRRPHVSSRQVSLWRHDILAFLDASSPQAMKAYYDALPQIRSEVWLQRRRASDNRRFNSRRTSA